MKLNIDAQTFPRYQTIGIIGIVMILIVSMSGYFFAKNHFDNQARLSDLRANVVQLSKEHIQTEVDASLDYIRFMQDQAEAELIEKSRKRVDQSYAVVQAIYKQANDKYPESEVKQLIREAFRDERFFDGRGYLFISQLDGRSVLQPDDPELEGKILLYDKDDSERVIVPGLITATQNLDKAGHFRYRWFVPGDRSQMRDKIAYVRQFSPFNWIIGTGDYLFQVENDLKAATLKRLEAIRFGKNGYIAVFTEDGQMLSGPTKYADIYDVRHKQAIEKILVAAKSNGIAEYEWYYPDGRGPVEKVSLVTKVPGWNWILVAGFYPDDINQMMSVQHQKLNNIFIEDSRALLMALGGAFTITLILSLLGAKWLRILFDRYQSNIDHQQTVMEQTTEELRYLAKYDPLTGLANRRLLKERVQESIFWAKQYSEQNLALLFIDLDRFKSINDSLGHTAGDQVLQQFAKRLSFAVSSTDTVCRSGGDEFVILMTKQKFPEAAYTMAKHIMDTIAKPVQIEGRELVLTPSIGIALYPKDGQDFDTLLRNADTALYHAKGQGKNNYQFYTEHMSQLVSEQLEMERALRQAIEADEFTLYYQPQYQLSDGTLSGYEALIRWNHPINGFQAPDSFIPLAECTGLIRPIGNWVLHSACQQGASWLARGFPKVRMAVNLSPHQFSDDLVTSVQQALAESGFPATLLTLEVTESALMNDAEQAIQLLTQLKALGISIALDDFGTGYSSLSYLKRFPLDELKIDKSFIDGLPDDQDDRALTSSIIDIARNLGLHTVAEGIETEAQRNFLIDIGCDLVQGYFYAKPIPSAEVEKLFTKNEQAQEQLVSRKSDSVLKELAITS